MKLKGRVVSGFIWSSVERFGSLLIQLGAQIILARLLLPELFGLIAIASIFGVIATSFVDSGFSQALIQKKDVEEIDYNSVFYLNIALSIVLYILVVALSSPISRFYDAPEIATIAPVIFLMVPANAFCLIQRTIFMKKMDFKTISKANLIAATVASIVAVVLAYMGGGLWALVANIVVLHVMQGIMLWTLSSWRPKAEFSMASIKSLYGLGSRLFATGLITNVFNNMPQLIIGKVFKPMEGGALRQVGLYSQSLKYKNIVADSVALPVQNVTFPAFSTLQDDDEKLKLSTRKVINLLSFAVFPVMLGLVAVADEAFYVLFREKWLPAVPYFRVLCLSGLFLPLANISLNIMKALGRGNLILTLEIVKKIFAVGVVAYAATISVMAVTWAYLIWMGFEMLLNIIYIRKIIGYKFREQLTDTLPYLIIAGVMYLLVEICGSYIAHLSPLPLLLIKVLIGIVVYLSLAAILRPSAWGESMEILDGLRKKVNVRD